MSCCAISGAAALPLMSRDVGKVTRGRSVVEAAALALPASSGAVPRKHVRWRLSGRMRVQSGICRGKAREKVRHVRGRFFSLHKGLSRHHTRVARAGAVLDFARHGRCHGTV